MVVPYERRADVDRCPSISGNVEKAAELLCTLLYQQKRFTVSIALV